MSDLEDKIAAYPTPLLDVNKYVHLDEQQQGKALRSAESQHYKKLLRSISPEGDWDLSQLILQEVAAKYIIMDPSKKLPYATILIEDYRIAVQDKYPEEPRARELLLTHCAPSLITIRTWLANEKFMAGVWGLVKNTGLFTAERRAAMVNALYHRGLEKDTNAAKLYLQLSGDLVERSEVTTDSTVDKYREINKILHKKN